jgi:uncharacterized protein
MSDMILPEYLDIRRLAGQEAVFVGLVPNRAMRRLAASMASEEGSTKAELQFGLDPVRRPTIRGWAITELMLECQRCLEIYRQPLNVQFDLVLVQGEAEAEHLSDGQEPLLTDQEQIRTAELIEDELMLALPIVAMHANEEDCVVQHDRHPAVDDEADEQRKPNPFAALEALKRKQD